MATTGIYKITDKQNKKIYIGQSVNIEKRWTTHRNNLQKLTGIDLAISQKGVGNFNFEIIEECSREKLNEREIFWISYYNSFHKGYNQTSGGDSPYWAPVKLSIEQVNKIKHLLKNTNEGQTSIARKFNVSQPTIAMINNGETWKDNHHHYPIRKIRIGYLRKKEETYKKLKLSTSKKSKVLKPSKEKLLRKIKENKGNFTTTANEFNVSPASIRRWCASYNLSASSLDYRPKKERTTNSDPIAVAMVDINTEQVIRVFSSFSEAERFLQKKSGARHIREVCRGERQTAYGYKWQYADKKKRKEFK